MERSDNPNKNKKPSGLFLRFRCVPRALLGFLFCMIMALIGCKDRKALIMKNNEFTDIDPNRPIKIEGEEGVTIKDCTFLTVATHHYDFDGSCKSPCGADLNKDTNWVANPKLVTCEKCKTALAQSSKQSVEPKRNEG